MSRIVRFGINGRESTIHTAWPWSPGTRLLSGFVRCALALLPYGLPFARAIGSVNTLALPAVSTPPARWAATSTADSDSLVPASAPWNPTDWTGRVVVGEYLTGVFCEACQAHEHAFDALLHRYPATAFVALAYHGGGDMPIGNPTDSLWERLYDWYGFPQGVKVVRKGIMPIEAGWDDWIDGHATTGAELDGALASGAAQRPAAEAMYRAMVTAIDAELHKAPEAALQVQATSHGGTVVTRVTIRSLAPSHADVYVRLLLVEDTVRLVLQPGAPGTPRLVHYMVVRSVASAPKVSLGVPLHGPGSLAYTFDVAAVQQSLVRNRGLGLADIVGASAADTAIAMDAWQVMPVFRDAHNWGIDRARLHVVAFVQDAHTGDVLQTQIVPVQPARSAGEGAVDSAPLPGIPHRPDVVTVVPFQPFRDVGHLWGQDDTIPWIMVQAEVDGHRGTFSLDTGSPVIFLGAAYLRPSPTSGLDTAMMGDPQTGNVTVHTVRLGTLVQHLDSTVAGLPSRAGYATNAQVQDDPADGELGNLGLTALEPFETIVDYRHQRVVLIRLDRGGRRLVAVPAYTPAGSVPLIPSTVPGHATEHSHWGIEVRRGDIVDSIIVDTGSPTSDIPESDQWRVADQLKHALLTDPHSGHRPPRTVTVSGEKGAMNLLCAPFLNRLGVVGFNVRTRQLILYR